ncbi:unnamed protein product [Ixodes hexagonus]
MFAEQIGAPNTRRPPPYQQRQRQGQTTRIRKDPYRNQIRQRDPRGRENQDPRHGHRKARKKRRNRRLSHGKSGQRNATPQTSRVPEGRHERGEPNQARPILHHQPRRVRCSLPQMATTRTQQNQRHHQKSVQDCAGPVRVHEHDPLLTTRDTQHARRNSRSATDRSTGAAATKAGRRILDDLGIARMLERGGDEAPSPRRGPTPDQNRPHTQEYESRLQQGKKSSEGQGSHRPARQRRARPVRGRGRIPTERLRSGRHRGVDRRHEDGSEREKRRSGTSGGRGHRPGHRRRRLPHGAE